MNAEFKIDPEFKLLLPPLTTEEYSELEKSLLGGKGPRPVLIPVFLTQGGHDVPNRQFRMLLPDLRHGSARHGKPVLDFPDFINHLVAESAMAKKFWQCLFRICVRPIPVASSRRSPRLRVRDFPGVRISARRVVIAARSLAIIENAGPCRQTLSLVQRSAPAFLRRRSTKTPASPLFLVLSIPPIGQINCPARTLG